MKDELLLKPEEINEAHAQGVYECMNLHKHQGSTPRVEGRKAIAKAQLAKAKEHFRELCDTCDQLPIADTGTVEEAKKQERERILNQMERERCDPDVMAYFEDYRWLPEDIWQALKEEK